MDLKGIYVPHVTPFNEKGEIDYVALKECIDFWIKNGVDGLVTLGSNGEFPYLTHEEKLDVVRKVVDYVNGRTKIIVGTGAPSTYETIKLSKDILDIGRIDALIIVTPYYFPVSSNELLSHYSEILDKVDAPLILYDVPKFTGYSMDVTVIEKLVNEYSNIVGIKDSSGNIIHISETIRTVGSKISVMAGTADFILPVLVLGGRGAIVAVANFIPELVVRLYKCFLEKKLEDAAQIQLNITAIWNALRKFNQLSAVKACMILRGINAGYPRKPSLPLNSEDMKNIKNVLLKYANI
ncbi:MAG: 4-hydroxy-tetrahydrodipicolinate synthase [Candidatus Methanomethylicia archaeon]|nr:4-hydroxy-tetrahydrodipicolinate synthase [Candidatus Methanomethylicia archaeon]MCX8169229.1 4-hydroxy-tetrahydrodipicolinate synthase [Candidatus Methanomethylicia archaeon]MDW7988989.1 4-hydroxy-tetrahydrodipicolinate synthase [Nitrososphaerota archaeon]